MNTLRHILCVTAWLLYAIPGMAQEPDPVLYLELGAMTTDSQPVEGQHTLMLELIIESEDRAWLEQEFLSDADGTQPGQPGVSGRLLLELSPLSTPGLGSDPDVTQAFLTAHPGVLLLDLSPMTGTQITAEELAALTQQHPGVLLLELAHLLDENLDLGEEDAVASLTPETLLLELSPIAGDNVTADMLANNPDALLLLLEAIQRGPALHPVSDFESQLLAYYAPFLVGHWRLTEGAGDTAWDYSQYEHDGALFDDLAWTSDGLQFNQGYIEVMQTPPDESPNVQRAFTMSAWVYLQDVASDQKLFGKLAPERAGGFLLRVLDGQLCPMIWDAAESAYVDLWGSIPANIWTHLAVTWERGGDLIGYMNGAEIGRIRASAQPVGVSDTALMIGADPLDAASAPVHGVVVEVRLYEARLPATAIKLLATGWGNRR